MSFFTMAGGGVLGKGIGIAPGTIVQVGYTINKSHYFIGEYHQVGEITIENIVGEDIHGTTNEYPSIKSTRTGATGKKTDIGRNKIPGVSRA
ncbi:hypothetical protein PITCH_A190060 [uncultured Desulfobacterium sp.]|uniref:Uncharacterized protein n=1 Tax=uncultured Desulfobacterium sp. TaxID=201089 RepID=A0A445MVE1_9BACT|nr:hypothetical protein PITCH_A190060 [uncultured Desulfobacterium sp.]